MKLSILRIHILVVLAVLTVIPGHSAGQQNPTLDLVAYFKIAMRTPPDVDSFIASQRKLTPMRDFSTIENVIGQDAASQVSKNWQSIAYYRGARSGSNYFLLKFANSNLLNELSEVQLIIGSAGNVNYQLSKNGITYGVGTNAVVNGNRVYFMLISQLLNLGFGELIPESLVWSNNQFQALNKNDLPVFGKLEITNNAPYRLLLSKSFESSPKKIAEYTYPNPPGALGGFPAKIKVTTNPFDDKLSEVIEIELFFVHTSVEPMPINNFSSLQFLTDNITHTNIYTNANFYFFHSGKFVKLPNNLLGSQSLTNNHLLLIRLVLVPLILVPGLIAVLFLWFNKRRQADNHINKST